jgi:hypothetical protein
MKTDRYFFELFCAPIVGLVLGFVAIIHPEILRFIDSHVIITKSIDISFIVFGFLLTVLALIVQSNLKFIKSKLYPRLVRYNKRIVFLSLFAGLYSLFYNSVISTVWLPEIMRFCIGIFIFLFVWIIIDLVIFIKVFYRLAEDGSV